MVPFYRTSRGQRSLLYTAPLIWNNLSVHLKALSNINTFKFQFKRHLLQLQSNEMNWFSKYHSTNYWLYFKYPNTDCQFIMLWCVFCLEYSFLMSAAILSRLSQFVIYWLSKLCTCFVGNKLYVTLWNPKQEKKTCSDLPPKFQFTPVDG